MTFAEKVLRFYTSLKLTDPLPEGVQVMNPYLDAGCIEVCRQFYGRFYNDLQKRFLILGINPGRYGAGITGIPFTDPIKLEELFGIKNDLPKKPELSAEFIHAMIKAFGGYKDFFSTFFINSVSPLGFVRNGKNLNYYDTPQLKASLDPFIRSMISRMLDLGIHRELVFCLGEGENYKFLRKLNSEEKWFDEVVPLAHPRFIMQYRRKLVTNYIEDFVRKLRRAQATSPASPAQANRKGKRENDG
jgi:hypothetical protein